MLEANVRDMKLIQYLSEAYGKEKELETALEAHIAMTDRAPYKKRLRKHLTETKNHWRQVQRRIKKLGGSAGTPEQAAQTVVRKAASAVKGPMDALSGIGSEERQLKNAQAEYSEEAEEIARYTAIEAFAESVGDRETAKLARAIRRDEERMAKYLAGLIPQLAGAVVRAEVPSDQRQSPRRRSGGRRQSARAGGGGARARTTAASSSRASSSGRSRSGSSSRAQSGSSGGRARTRSGGGSRRRSSGS